MKRKFQITAAILSIVAGSLMCISAIVLLSNLTQLGDIFGEEMFVGFQIIAIILLLTSVAVIIIAGFLCQNKKSSNGLSIALIVILSVIAVLEIIGASASVVFYILLCLTAIGFNITYLCLKEKTPEPAKENESDTTEKLKEEVTNNETKTATKNKSVPEKIKLLMDLRDLGEISESEYKKLLIAELDDKEKLKKVKES